MNLEEFKRVGTAIQAILNEINSNPSKFALEILQMHIDVVKKRDQYKEERDKCLDDIEKFREESKEQAELLKEFSNFINYKLDVHLGNNKYIEYRSKLDKLDFFN
ncbi:hypothetical protein EUA50_03100 [Staphylococcus saprophyticus]|nr:MULTISPECIES: hypothetical protein [Staphylococcus]MDL1993688.1 hypothetical protein [Staphylococcus saprophyticus]MDT3924754.1 hypothetical protein [Staphylococcus saprophyticus]MDT3971653.1 hypothetical protein [Staphylococcus saprophyticus]MDT3977743.1 hypothetical protein [Staphylococcus saprophyticus]MDT3984997.1 hypothetical protein [Staphylococcus saprophyticus]